MSGLDRSAALAFRGNFPAAERSLRGNRSEGARWLRAYIAAARGEFADAEALAEPLARRATEPAVRTAASITLGSVLRQTARHRAAVRHDARALRLAPDRAARAHALIGLAADAIGGADAGACARRLRDAARAAPVGDWRVRVRLDWVRAEHSLLSGRPREAVRAARRALERARSAGARRHVAKSLLFLGASLEAAGEPGAARALADAERVAGRLGAAAVAVAARALAERLRAAR